MRLTASSASVAMKCRVVPPVNKVKFLPVYVSMKEILENWKVMGVEVIPRDNRIKFRCQWETTDEWAEYVCKIILELMGIIYTMNAQFYNAWRKVAFVDSEARISLVAQSFE